MLNSISRLGETRPEQEWSNGTEYFGYSDFPGIPIFRNFRPTPRGTPKIRKMTVPFAPQPGISRTFGRMESAPVSSGDAQQNLNSANGVHT